MSSVTPPAVPHNGPARSYHSVDRAEGSLLSPVSYGADSPQNCIANGFVSGHRQQQEQMKSSSISSSEASSWHRRAQEKPMQSRRLLQASASRAPHCGPIVGAGNLNVAHPCIHSADAPFHTFPGAEAQPPPWPPRPRSIATARPATRDYSGVPAQIPRPRHPVGQYATPAPPVLDGRFTVQRNSPVPPPQQGHNPTSSQMTSNPVVAQLAVNLVQAMQEGKIISADLPHICAAVPRAAEFLDEIQNQMQLSQAPAEQASPLGHHRSYQPPQPSVAGHVGGYQPVGPVPIDSNSLSSQFQDRGGAPLSLPLGGGIHRYAPVNHQAASSAARPLLSATPTFNRRNDQTPPPPVHVGGVIHPATASPGSSKVKRRRPADGASLAFAPDQPNPPKPSMPGSSINGGSNIKNPVASAAVNAPKCRCRLPEDSHLRSLIAIVSELYEQQIWPSVHEIRRRMERDHVCAWMRENTEKLLFRILVCAPASEDVKELSFVAIRKKRAAASVSTKSSDMQSPATPLLREAPSASSLSSSKRRCAVDPAILRKNSFESDFPGLSSDEDHGSDSRGDDSSSDDGSSTIPAASSCNFGRRGGGRNVSQTSSHGAVQAAYSCVEYLGIPCSDSAMPGGLRSVKKSSSSDISSQDEHSNSPSKPAVTAADRRYREQLQQHSRQAAGTAEQSVSVRSAMRKICWSSLRLHKPITGARDSSGAATSIFVTFAEHPTNFKGFIDPLDAELPYDKSVISVAADYLLELARSGKPPLRAGRFLMAQTIKADGPKQLRRLTLGQICHLAQVLLEHDFIAYDSHYVRPVACCEALTKATWARVTKQVAPNKEATLESIRSNVRELLKKHSDGIVLSQMRTAYEAMTNEPLPFNELGYTKLGTFISEAFKDVCKMESTAPFNYVVVAVDSDKTPKQRGSVVEPGARAQSNSHSSSEEFSSGSGGLASSSQDEDDVSTAPSDGQRCLKTRTTLKSSGSLAAPSAAGAKVRHTSAMLKTRKTTTSATVQPASAPVQKCYVPLLIEAISAPAYPLTSYYHWALFPEDLMSDGGGGSDDSGPLHATA